MMITVWQYNQVIDGLRMQLQLLRNLNIECNYEREQLQKRYSDLSGDHYKRGEEIAKLRRGVEATREAALQLCYQVEKFEPSKDQTRASEMASGIQSQLNELLK